MKPSRKLNKKTGVVLVDFIVAASLVALVTLSIVWLIVHLWVYNFLSLESYYLARSRLYGNTQSCESSKII